MVACSENVFPADAQLARNFSQSGAFIVFGVAETRINVVADNGQIRDVSGVFFEEFHDCVGVFVAARNEAERRPWIFIDIGGIMFLHPGEQAWHLGSYPREEPCMIAGAEVVPSAARHVMLTVQQMNLALNDDEVI